VSKINTNAICFLYFKASQFSHTLVLPAIMDVHMGPDRPTRIWAWPHSIDCGMS